MPIPRDTQPLPVPTFTVTPTDVQRARWRAAADYRGLTVEQWLAELACRDVGHRYARTATCTLVVVVAQQPASGVPHRPTP